MLKLLIISDDFTGALDTGVQFAKKGIKTLVVSKLDKGFFDLEADIQVLVVDTESRHMEPQEAYKAVFEIAEKVVSLGVKYIYKKTDSTLRGNIGSELAAIMDALDKDLLAFVPAFPLTGRTTIDGCQYVDGEMIHKTGFAGDPLNPVSCSYIPDIIGKQSSLSTVIVSKESYYNFKKPYSGKRTVYSFDSVETEDLSTIGRILEKEECLSVTAGCAGFAAFLPELLKLKRNIDMKDSFEKSGNKGIFVVCGSVNHLSLKQVEYAENHGYSSIALTPEAKLTENYFDSNDGIALIHRITADMAANKKLIVKVAGSRRDIEQTSSYSKSVNLDERDIPQLISGNLGKLVKQVIDRILVGTLVIFGGDTAVSVMNTLGCDGVIPLGEVAPGIVVSGLAGSKYKLVLITKAGGFGSESILGDIEKYLNSLGGWSHEYS